MTSDGRGGGRKPKAWKPKAWKPQACAWGQARGARRRARARGSVAATALAVLAAGCGLAGRGPAESDPEVTLHVTNQNFYDATLYATWESHRTRLGTVTGYASDTFAFRWQSTQLRIQIHLLSVGNYLTEPMSVSPGEELELFIQPDLHRRITRPGRGGRGRATAFEGGPLTAPSAPTAAAGRR